MAVFHSSEIYCILKIFVIYSVSTKIIPDHRFLRHSEAESLLKYGKDNRVHPVSQIIRYLHTPNEKISLFSLLMENQEKSIKYPPPPQAPILCPYWQQSSMSSEVAPEVVSYRLVFLLAYTLVGLVLDGEPRLLLGIESLEVRIQ